MHPFPSRKKFGLDTVPANVAKLVQFLKTIVPNAECMKIRNECKFDSMACLLLIGITKKQLSICGYGMIDLESMGVEDNVGELTLLGI